METLKLSGDGQVLVEGIHDSVLEGISRSSSGRVSLIFRSAAGARIEIATADAANAVVWAEGPVMPVIVARLTVRSSADIRSVLAKTLDSDALRRYEISQLGQVPAEWCLVVEPAVGGTVVVSGSGRGASDVTVRTT